MDEVSVITPTYFRNDLLERAIRSVKNQSYNNTEHIVVDGSEQEHAREVVEQYSDVLYLAPDPDPCFHKSRELALRKASGKFVQFLDDDDWLKPTKVEKSVDQFRDGVGVVYSGIEDDSSGRAELPDPGARGDVLYRALAFDMFPAVPSTLMIRRELLTDLIPFRHPDGADDEGTHIELAQRTRYEFVDEPLVVLGTEDEGFSATWEYVEGISSLVEEYSELYSQAPDWVKENALAKVHRKRGRMYLRDHYWSPSATWEFIQSARHSKNDKLVRWGSAFASVFGRPGVEAGNRVLSIVRE